jgi:hypothetical protein
MCRYYVTISTFCDTLYITIDFDTPMLGLGNFHDRLCKGIAFFDARFVVAKLSR